MNPYLKASIICFTIAIIALLLILFSCEKHYDMFGIDDDKTTYAMTVIGEKHSVRADFLNFRNHHIARYCPGAFKIN